MWTAEAPANIALIKYMGKGRGNIPCNPSLSYSIEKFRTKVVLEVSDKDSFINSAGLSRDAEERFLNHLAYVKKLLRCKECFSIKSENNFPHSAGIASSASSFAALTLCCFKAICEIKNAALPSTEEMSAVSRIASGSSCRSFFSPWAVWNGKSARGIELPSLLHDLVLLNGSAKEKSSSEAHASVRSSLLFKGRPQRAQLRFEKLIQSLKNGDWTNSYQICWEEFWDMHCLFETACPHFGYLEPSTIFVLRAIQKFWKDNNDGPLVTVDAGPNVHLLWRTNQESFRQNFLKMIGTFQIL